MALRTSNPAYSGLSYESLIVATSLCFAFLFWLGVYGYGFDFRNFYYQNNVSFDGAIDRVGYSIATLTVGDVHVGVFVVSFFVVFSLGLLFKENLCNKSIYDKGKFMALFVTAIHTWPIIMSTSNAMRQGLTMSFLFFALICFSRKMFPPLLFFCCLSIICHRSGLFFTLLIVGSYLVLAITRRVQIRQAICIHFCLGSVVFLIGFFGLGYLLPIDNPTRVIGHDQRFIFFLLSTFLICVFLIKPHFIKRGFNVCVFYFSFSSLSFLATGMNWEYERLFMVMFYPYIFAIGSFLKNDGYVPYLFVVVFGLFGFTVYFGMFASLKVA